MGKEKANVALENDAAQVEADKCAVIAKDVSELAARCEADLAAAEPLVAQAEAALDTLNKKDLGEPLLLHVRSTTQCTGEVHAKVVQNLMVPCRSRHTSRPSLPLSHKCV